MRPALVILLLLSSTAAAQEAGWRYSPYPGEGDRAALGCAYGSTPAVHACVAVRCEDDFTVAVHVDTTRPGGDGGRWTIAIDDSAHEVIAVALPGSAYGAKVEGDVTRLIDDIRHGGSLFLEPQGGAPAPHTGIGLSGSFEALNKALYFCAPRVVPEAMETTAQP